ncbi:metal transporter (plasmid) [Sphingomonas sp. HMP9]|nr:metal transporter [Sphingomonas sp. HMP9]
MTDNNNRLYAGAAIGLVLAAGTGFGIARLTAPSAPAVETAEAKPAAAPDVIVITADGIRTSEITVAPATGGGIDAAIPASATVKAAPDAEAVLTARAAGTVTRIFKRIGDPVRAGETIALVESRDASGIVADRSAAAARVTLASRQLARERTLLDQGVSPARTMRRHKPISPSLRPMQGAQALPQGRHGSRATDVPWRW